MSSRGSQSKICTVIQFALLFALIIKDFQYSEMLFDATLLRALDAYFEQITAFTDSVRSRSCRSRGASEATPRPSFKS